jgi:hypothetical protein
LRIHSKIFHLSKNNIPQFFFDSFYLREIVCKIEIELQIEDQTEQTETSGSVCNSNSYTQLRLYMNFFD